MITRRLSSYFNNFYHSTFDMYSARRLLLIIIPILCCLLGCGYFLFTQHTKLQNLQLQLTRYYTTSLTLYQVQNKQTAFDKSPSPYYTTYINSTINPDKRVSLINQFFIEKNPFSAIHFSQIQYKRAVKLSTKERQNQFLRKLTKSTLIIELTGKYPDVANYINYIHSLPLLFHFEKIQITPVSHNTSLTTMKVQLNIFFFNP